MPGNHSDISSNEFDNDNNKKKRKKKKKKKIDVTTISDDQTSNQLVMPSIPKSKNRFLTKIRKIPKSPKRCSSPPPCTSSSSRSGSSSHKGGCFRVMRPRRRKKKKDGHDGDDDDSCVSSPTSDPNDERFSHDMLRVMLETNDFWSNECNSHR